MRSRPRAIGHQPRDRAAGFHAAETHPRGGREGGARRAARLYEPARIADASRRGGAIYAEALRRACFGRGDRHRSGGKVTFYFACQMFGGPGTEILYPDPGFPPYRDAARSSGAKPVPYPIREEKDFGFDAEEVLSLITPATRLIIINSPANPTGGVVSRQEITKLAEGLLKHPDVAILSTRSTATRSMMASSSPASSPSRNSATGPSSSTAGPRPSR